MKLPSAPAQYNQRDQINTRAQLIEEDARNFKKNEEINAVRLVLKDTVTGTRYVVSVASGALAVTAI